MFAKINGELYKVQGNKMVKVVIKNGAIKSDGKVQDYNGGAYLLTMNEVKRQYASLFNVDADVKEEVVENKKKEVKADVATEKVDTDVKEEE